MSEKQEVNSDIELFKNGDPQFFETLYIAYFEKLCAYALNYISDKEAIQDLVQDVFINLWTRRKKIIITRSLNSYMYKIVYYKIMDAHRNAKKKNDVLSSYYKDALDFVIESHEDYLAERLNKLNNCIEELPEKCKKVFIAKKITNLKNEQVTEQLNISIKTMEGHITKAFKFIRNCMNHSY